MWISVLYTGLLLAQLNPNDGAAPNQPIDPSAPPPIAQPAATVPDNEPMGENTPSIGPQPTVSLADAADQATIKVNTWIGQGKLFLQTEGPRFAVNLIGALLIFLIGKWLAGFLTRIASRMATRAKVDDMLVMFMSNIMFYLMMIVVTMAALELLGVQTTSLTAILAAAGFAIGLALQGSLSNFAAGVILIVFKPFRTGDLINAAGVTGIVEEIQVFNSIIRTFDNIQMIVPNGSITSGNISNFTVKGTRRIDLVIGCAYSDDLLAVKDYLIDLLNNHPRVLKSPQPTVEVAELAESSVNFNVRPWVKSTDFGSVKAELIERIKIGFDAEGFTFPFPSRELFLHKDVV